MICVTPDGIKANQRVELHKNGDVDARVMAHLEDVDNVLQHAIKDQQMDIDEEDGEGEKKYGPIATVLRNAGADIKER